MMLIRHKTITLMGQEISKAITHSMFGDLVKDYSRVFNSVATLVFDIAPYLKYLDESNTDLLEMFSAETE